MREAIHLRPMTAADIAAAAALERQAFEEELTPTAFEAELERNPVARYIVLEAPGGAVAGFAGLWLQLDEAHVVNVVVAPQLRGRGYGQLLLHGLVDLAGRYGMTVATLEVRPGNAAARGLYRAYGFYEVGERKSYYRDGGDAVIMTTEELASPAYRRRFEQLGTSLRARLGIEQITLGGVSFPDLAD